MNDTNNEQIRKGSIKSLMCLYSTVAALGLTTAMYKMVNDGSPDVSVNWGLLPFLGTYLVTMIPFYHGAMVHLNRMYYNNCNIRCEVILVNFVMLFAESCLLVGMGLLLGSPQKFAWVLVMLLGIDVLWGVLCACFASPRTNEQPSESRWAKLNFFAGTILLLFLVVLPLFQDKLVNWRLGFILLIWTSVRTGIDYLWCWNLYFPSINNDESFNSDKYSSPATRMTKDKKQCKSVSIN